MLLKLFRFLRSVEILAIVSIGQIREPKPFDCAQGDILQNNKFNCKNIFTIEFNLTERQTIVEALKSR